MLESPHSMQEFGEEAMQRRVACFFEATYDGVLFLNRQWVYTFLNRRAREILAPGGGLIGKCMWEVFPAANDVTSPIWLNYHRTMDEGVPIRFEVFYGDPLNIFFDVQTFPAYDDGIILLFRDITTDHNNREELRRSREEVERQFAEIEAVYRTAPIGLALFDLDDYHYLRLNDRQAAFFGLTPEQIIGRTLMELAPIQGLRELFDQVASGGPPVINAPLEGTLINDPEHRYWVASYFPVLGPDGTIQGITAATIEITQQKKGELALIETDKLAAVGRLASSIAHEINNPLESITNLLYLARHSESLDQATGYLATAEHELQRIAAVTRQTLHFHKQSTSPQEITGQTLIESVLSMYQGRIVNTGVTVRTRFRPAKQVQCFEGEIRQVISNLLGNALDALRPRGTIFLRSREGTRFATGNRGIVITLADNGSGMNPANVTKIFRPFFTTKGLIGTGLGLWICQEIVTRHNGTLHVRSREGHGTVFTLFLPFDAVTRNPGAG